VAQDCKGRLRPWRPHECSGYPPRPESAVAQIDIHSSLLREMIFCRGVNSFLTYLADLMTLIYEKYPKKLPPDKKATYEFCIEHHLRAISYHPLRRRL
jgi:hypothetical protein